MRIHSGVPGFSLSNQPRLLAAPRCLRVAVDQVNRQQRLVVVPCRFGLASRRGTTQVVLNLPRLLGHELLDRVRVAGLHYVARQQIGRYTIDVAIPELIHRLPVDVGLYRGVVFDTGRSLAFDVRRGADSPCPWARTAARSAATTKRQAWIPRFDRTRASNRVPPYVNLSVLPT